MRPRPRPRPSGGRPASVSYYLSRQSPCRLTTTTCRSRFSFASIACASRQDRAGGPSSSLSRSSPWKSASNAAIGQAEFALSRRCGRSALAVVCCEHVLCPTAAGAGAEQAAGEPQTFGGIEDQRTRRTRGVAEKVHAAEGLGDRREEGLLNGTVSAAVIAGYLLPLSMP